MQSSSRARYQIFALVVTAVFASDVRAQTGTEPPPVVVASALQFVEASPALVAGDTLRVWSTPARLNGIIAAFARVSPSELVLLGQAATPNTAPREWAVALNNVERFEVLRRRNRSAGRVVLGVVLGAALGAAIGAPLAPIIECGGACDTEGNLKPKVGSKLGAMIGAPIGGLLGGVFAGTRPARWHTVTFTVR